MKKDEILEDLLSRKAVAVIRVQEEDKLQKVIEALYEGGITCAEITMTVPNAIDLIKKMSENLGEKVLIGVGSVLNGAVAGEAVKAGAKYVVSPILKKEIIDTAHRFDVPAMPGCFTPTEIQTAYEWGADLIKVFPADVLGMEFFKGILAPMPHLKLMPTGGVTLTNAGEWLKAGASAVGLGSALLDKQALKEENYEKITRNAESVMACINDYISKKGN